MTSMLADPGSDLLRALNGDTCLIFEYQSISGSSWGLDRAKQMQFLDQLFRLGPQKTTQSTESAPQPGDCAKHTGESNQCVREPCLSSRRSFYIKGELRSYYGKT